MDQKWCESTRSVVFLLVYTFCLQTGSSVADILSSDHMYRFVETTPPPEVGRRTPVPPFTSVFNHLRVFSHLLVRVLIQKPSIEKCREYIQEGITELTGNFCSLIFPRITVDICYLPGLTSARASNRHP